MKTSAGILICLLVFSLWVPADEENLLEIDVSINPYRLSRGQEGKVIIKITLEEGIDVNAQPSFQIEFTSSDELVFPKNFFTASDLEIEILKENGFEYLNLSAPLEIPFTVSLEAERGNHTLEGKIKYFACSKEEGWCLKNSTKFTARFYTRSTIYQ
jgi:hypothetical protein